MVFFISGHIRVRNNQNRLALVGMEFHHDFIVVDTFRTRKVQTALSLVFTNYRAEPSVRFRHIQAQIKITPTRGAIFISGGSGRNRTDTPFGT